MTSADASRPTSAARRAMFHPGRYGNKPLPEIHDVSAAEEDGSHGDLSRREVLALAGGCLSSAVAWAIPAPPGRLVTPAFFGTHLHRLVLNAGEQRRRTDWPALPFGVLRLWDAGTQWADLEPRPDQWRFARMDAYVNAAQEHGTEVLYTLGGTPRWASARPHEPGPYGPGGAAEPADLEAWERYVTQIVRRYRRRISAYEVWNEPQFSDIARDRSGPVGFYSGSLATLLRMTRVARRVIDTIDPHAKLLTPGFVNGTDRLEMFLAEGGAELVDAVAYHFYARDVDHLTRQIDEVRSVMRRHRVHKPLWNTEFGAETWADDARLPPGVLPADERQAAAHLARCVLVNAAAGLERCCYYAWDNDRSGMVDPHGHATLRWRAMRDVQQWLTGARVSPWRPAVRHQALTLDTNGDRAVVAWATGHRANWPVPAGWRVAGVQPLLEEFTVVGVDAGTQTVPLTHEPTLIRLARRGVTP